MKKLLYIALLTPCMVSILNAQPAGNEGMGQAAQGVMPAEGTMAPMPETAESANQPMAEQGSEAGEQAPEEGEGAPEAGDSNA